MYLSHPREKINLAGHKKNCSYCKKVVAYNFTDVLLFALWITYTLIVYRHFSPLFFSLCVKLYWPPSSVLPNFCLFHSVLTCVNGLNETNFPWKFMNYKIQRAYFSFTFTTTYLGTKRVQVKKKYSERQELSDISLSSYAIHVSSRHQTKWFSQDSQTKVCIL